MKKNILYRISSQGYPKLKVTTVNKYDCLENLFKHFPDWNFICVADNCSEELLNGLSKFPFARLFKTNLGNPASFWYLYDSAFNTADDDDIFYFIEDDYLHLESSSKAIEEGLQLFDYVTLYDHPDKYKLSKKFLNPYVKFNRYSEKTEVAFSDHFTWRTTNSTTLTFALKGSTLKDDYNVWKITRDVQRDHGFDNFCILTKQKLIPKSRIFRQYPRKLRYHFKKKKYLGVCIPGLSIHLEKPYIKPNDFVRFSIPD